MRIVVLVTLLALPFVASAQCTKDTDCKGDRVCNAGTCVAPTPAANPNPAGVSDLPPPPPPPPPAYVPSQPSTSDFAAPRAPAFYRPRHWAGAAGVIGLIGATLIAPVGVYASFITSSAGTIIGAGVLLTAAIVGPLVAVGAASARRNGGVNGSPGLRVFGLISYALGMAAGAATIVVGLLINPSPILGITCTSLGFLGILFMSIDALVSAGQAHALPEAPRTRAAAGPLIVPVLSAARGVDGQLAPVAGVGGVF